VKKIYRIIFLAIILFFFRAEESLALTVSPPLLELTSRPGEVVSGEVKIFNEAPSAATFDVSLVDFESRGEDGIPAFSDSIDSRFGLTSLMKVDPQSVTIKPSEWLAIPYSISIPSDAEPGSRYATLFFTNQEVHSKGLVGIEPKVGILFLLKIDGDVDELGKIVDFKIGKGNKNFFEYTPLTFETRFENLGNVHLKPQGMIDIFNMKGKKITQLPVNKEDVGGNVLPKSFRRFESQWDENEGVLPQTFFGKVKYEWKNFRFGKYKADLKLAYGSHGEIGYAQLNFWMIPWQLITVLLVFMVIVLLLIRFGIRRYNRWIVKRMSKSKN
jgi:hypothetical protein